MQYRRGVNFGTLSRSKMKDGKVCKRKNLIRLTWTLVWSLGVYTVHTYINVHLYTLEREVRNTEGVGGRIKDTPHQGT